MHLQEPTHAPRVLQFTVKVGALNKNKRLYHCSASLPNNTEMTLKPFSYSWDLEYNQLKRGEHFLPKTLQGKLPNNYFFSNYTTNMRNCSQRATEIQLYLNHIFLQNGVLTGAQYHKSLGLTEISNYLQTIASEQEKEFEQLFYVSQHFFEHEEANVPILRFRKSMQFTIDWRNDWQMDILIFGPNSKPWFKISKVDVSGARVKECRLVLKTMSDDTLISMEKDHSEFAASFIVKRFDKLGKAHEWYKMSKVSSHYGKSLSVSPMDQSCTPIKHKGNWSSPLSAFADTNGNTINVTKQSLLHSQKICVSLPEQSDVILYLALTVLAETLSPGSRV
jgi:hypothetical protein